MKTGSFGFSNQVEGYIFRIFSVTADGNDLCTRYMTSESVG